MKPPYFRLVAAVLDAGGGTRTLEDEIVALGDRRIAVGGAGLAAECMRRGVIDEFELFVIPIVVGGARLLPAGRAH